MALHIRFFLLEIYTAPVFSNGVVFIGSGDHHVYAINASTGILLWNYDTGLWIDSSPKVLNGVVYINNEAVEYFALNATNGKKLDIDRSIIADIVGGTSAVAGPDEVYIEAQLYGNNIYSINASNNAQIWKSNIIQIESSPVVIDNVVCIAGAAVNGDILYALNITNGVQLWTYPLWTNQNGGINLSSFSYANGILYVQPYEGNLYAYNISSVLPSIPTPSPTPTPTVPEVPFWASLLLLTTMVVAAGLLVYCTKGNQWFSQETWTKKYSLSQETYTKTLLTLLCTYY